MAGEGYWPTLLPFRPEAQLSNKVSTRRQVAPALSLECNCRRLHTMSIGRLARLPSFRCRSHR